MKKAQLILLLFVTLLTADVYSQYGIIVLKNGEEKVMVEPELLVEKESLRYFNAPYKPKVSFMGIGYKKLKKEMLSKTGLVKISNIERIDVEGELLVGRKSVLNFIGIRYIKIKKRYQKFYVIEDGTCKLLVQPENNNALYSYYVQTGNEEPYKIHQVGTAIGAKFKKRSKKYFADCAPAIDYISGDLKRSTLATLVKIYNENCIK